MALKMTVNDKLEANVRQRNKFLADPQRVKKELENERRITRLQQVREKSNSLARHIRQEVAAEKERQVRNLEDIKQQELNAWRDHVVAKKYQDYRTSMFQVGAAHRAAQAETERTEQQKQQRVEKIKNCRRLATKRSVKHAPSTVLRSTAGKDLNVEGRATAGTQTPAQANEGKENRRLCNKKACKVVDKHDSGKRKCNGKHESNAREAPIILSDSSNSSSDENADELTSNEPGGRKLQKTPPVILDVDIESEDSLEICCRDGIEINDLYKQTNRQFSRVVHPNPTSTSELRRPVTETCDAIPSRPRFTQISDLVRRTTLPNGTREKTGSQPQEQHTQLSQSPTRSLSPNRAATTAPADSSIGSPTRPATKQPTSSNRRQPLQKKRSSLRSTNAKKPAPAKVIDAGLRRSATSVQPATTVESNSPSTAQPATAKSTAEPAIEQPRKQQPMRQPPVHQLPMQQPLVQQMPMLQPQMQPLPPYMHPPMHPHAMYPAHMITSYPLLPYPMQPYPMAPVGQYIAPQPGPPPQVPVTNPATSTSTTPLSTTASNSGVSSTTYVTRQGQCAETNTTASGHVQFYDHNNKYQRNYKAPEKAVQVNQQDNTQPNAMDQARIETQLRQQREQELANLRQVTDQRGQKALQREQVRRDCAELTEKLEALTQQQPQLLPSDANFVPSHRFADLALQREQRMNAAMEEMLLRPAIVTCPEVSAIRQPSPRKSGCRSRKSSLPDAINVGEPPADKADDAVSTNSCCSMLLDYVNDQSKQLHTELKGMQSNSKKCMKLKSLLQRIEKIRAQLLAELQAGEMSGDHAQKVIDAIRQERASIHTDTARDLNQRERELQQKEELLEQRLRQLYKQQQRADGQQERKKPDENPVEIIIKVKSDGTVKQYVPKGKVQDKADPKAITEEGSNPTTCLSTGIAAPSQTTAVINERQISIDSTSTTYRELPPVNYKNVKAAAAPAPPAEPARSEPLHPVVAQYVQRLLGMSRSSIDQLGVSTSEVPTPTESIIKNPRNVSSGSTVDETLIANQRVERVQAFIQENRSFVNELEDTLRTQQKEQQQQQQKESSARVFDQIWNRRLANNQQLIQQQPHLEQEQARETERPTTSRRAYLTRRPAPVAPEVASGKSTARSEASKMPQCGRQNQMAVSETTKTRITETQRQRLAEPTNTSVVYKSSSEQCAARQIERYAMLTENCTQRIAELTELITKVREEKQRLVEVTLTSASECEPHSTEYLDLPQAQGQQQHQELHRSRTVSDRSDSHDTTPSHSEALPLQKHNPTGASLDSGIAGSRPLTAMGQEPPETEPTSLASSTQSGAPRRGKVPPATIRRYSPQLAAEELAHELSTITEVDTPAQSHMVAATPAPMPFPTFDEYARELQLDLANMDRDQSMRLQHEFHELIDAIKQGGHVADYREFPSVSAYLHNITTTTTRINIETEGDQQSLAAGDLLQQLRLPNVTIREFPNRREYLQQLLADVPPEQREMIDSASLDSSDSFNVEAELRQRRLLKSSFRREPAASQPLELDVASSTRRESIPPDASAYAPNESGIEPLSRSPVPIDVQPNMQCICEERPTSMRSRQPPAEAANTSVSNDAAEQRKRCAGGSLPQNLSRGTSVDTPQEVSQMGRSLNLREFLTKELLKHRVHNRESSSDNTDDSLKSNFLQSVIDSLSLSSSLAHTPTLGQATNGTNDRQKTSTPVGSLLSAHGSGSSHSEDPQLFSVESRISAVHYADGTPPVPYEQQTMSAARSSRAPRPTNRKISSSSRK